MMKPQKIKIMEKSIAENCLKFLLTYTKEGDILWNDQSRYEKGYELYTWRDDEASWSAYLYVTYNYKLQQEVCNLHLKVEDKHYTFGIEYEKQLEDLYACMTTIQDMNSNVQDADFTVIDTKEDNTPFEFVINVNYDSETLGV